ncbi:MAG: AAA family ATPase [Hormoscilla sp. SP5CHS1]|nr:AAA family ATPase [Hormoscilla sp. SP12CHS1]MBC6453762.1 AAA family ATPase [Hormoscilla sp. SP5CHS1]
MFKQITLKNYRTHKSTTIDIHPVTLLIGNNNSGKTNLLAGIQHFASLLRRSHPQHPKFNQPVSAEDYYPHRYRLAGDDESLSISIVWENHEGKIVYDLVLYENEEMIISCREKIQIDASKTVSSGYDRVELRI